MPDKVWLIRGNHEDRQMNQKYGFSDACEENLGPEFGMKTFGLVQQAFDQLPLAALIDEQVLVVHGGIGNGKWSVDDLRHVQRPLGEEIHAKGNEWIFNILWSDPIEEDAVARKDSSAVFGVHRSARSSTALQFGWNVTKTFCARNGLNLLVRSHQCKAQGSGFDVMHEDMLMRVFSARDYEGMGNDAAILSMRLEDPDRNKVLIIRPQVLQSIERGDLSVDG
mmetsp:Transcript_58645/g.105392  ORF Transcript_58645/g.105392 Transcript_58645/m.105392 type:complete len:223 (+) Transcript_58645:96-764(+)|eukprot:CAMPEP_0115050502 /NCGR_PEP_ID=MMETSP0227-20121206/1817_1 /TAXON_ID=89957 /ORGANISM="Polarella glacialis, Strain CCMP 1383" /LENGTH=222 /DNA_ID=CAMNT_0002434359 /DNA_START=101 /DNA_END=769 /DNA_ORIENTATION=-